MINKHSIYYHAFQQIMKNKLALFSLIIILIYVLLAILVSLGVVAKNVNEKVAEPFLRPSLEHPLGTDALGRDIFNQVLYGAKVAIMVGIITSIIAIPIGVVLGSIAGYFGGWIDDIIVWFYSTLASIPGLLLILALTLVVGRGLTGVYISIGLATWVSLCRIIRAETIKIKNLEFVQAAKALGVPDIVIIFRHILPNVMHLVLIYFALQFVYAIKSEVILSYIGVGAQSQPSWGLIIQDAQNYLFVGYWYGFAGATIAMFILILALNIFSDALRDALDPKFKN